MGHFTTEIKLIGCIGIFVVGALFGFSFQKARLDASPVTISGNTYTPDECEEYYLAILMADAQDYYRAGAVEAYDAIMISGVHTFGGSEVYDCVKNHIEGFKPQDHVWDCLGE